MNHGMKIFASLCFAAGMAVLPQAAPTAEAAAATTAVNEALPQTASYAVLPFVDRSRYQHVDTGARLENLTQDALLRAGSFDVKVLDELSPERQGLLYDKEYEEEAAAAEAADTGDLGTLFESDAYQGRRPLSFDEASVGDCVQPELLAQLGKESGAEYFITGTYLGFVSKLHKSNWYLYGSETQTFDVQVDFKILRASDGKVVWQKKEKGSSKKKAERFYLVGNGGYGLSEEMYMTALTNAAYAFVQDLSGNGTK